VLRLDLMRLENGARFQKLCERLINRGFPKTVGMNVASWDGGRDIVAIGRPEGDTIVHDVVWQVKFTNRLDSATKRSIKESIEKLASFGNIEPRRWILCLPVDPTGPFHDWLVKAVPPEWNPEIWGQSRLLELLEKNPDIAETFFYADFEELRRYFVVENLELDRLTLDPACTWQQSDPKVLNFWAGGRVASPDLVFDIIVRNTGRADAVL
jgi:hypothetical protein